MQSFKISTPENNKSLWCFFILLPPLSPNAKNAILKPKYPYN